MIVDEPLSRVVDYKLMKHQLVEFDFVCQDDRFFRTFEVMYHGITDQEKSSLKVAKGPPCEVVWNRVTSFRENLKKVVFPAFQHSAKF